MKKKLLLFLTILLTSTISYADTSMVFKAAGGLTGLSDVGSATITAGRILVADGTDFQSVAVSGDCTITSAGLVDCTGNLGATQLTGLTDVGSSTVGAGRLLINDGTKFQSVSTYFEQRISAASSDTNYPLVRGLAYAATANSLKCCIDSGTSALVTIKQCGSNYPVVPGVCNTIFAQTTCDQDCATQTVTTGASALTGGHDIRIDTGTVTGTVNNLTVTITGP